MSKASELLARASHFRDLAYRARQSAHELAATFSDKTRLKGIIADLEAQALALEKQDATLTRIDPTSTTPHPPLEPKSSPRSRH